MIQRKTPLKRTGIKKLTYEEALAKVRAKQVKKKTEIKEAQVKPRTKTIKSSKKSKKPTVSQLKKRADTAFSIYIRLRDAEFRSGSLWCQCITCSSWKPIKQIQNGHFQSRRYMNTRFHEQNCHAQCVKCNIFNQGEQYKYSLYVDKRYGPGTSTKLEQLAKQIRKFKTYELEEMILQYKTAIKEYERKYNGQVKETQEPIYAEE